MQQMIRLATFFFFVHFVAFSTYATTKGVDSLLNYQRQLKNTHQSKEKIKLYYKLFDYLLISRPKLAATYLEKGHRLSVKTHSNYGLSWYHKIIAYQALSSGDYQQGIYQSALAARFSLKNKDTINFLESSYYKSFGYLVNNQAFLAKKTIYGAFELIQYKGFYKQQGMLYSILAHSEKAINLVRSFEFMQMSYRAHMKAHNKAALYSIYSDLSAFYDDISDYQEALYYSQKALVSLRDNQAVNYFDLATVEMNIGYCYQRLQKYNFALKHFTSAIHAAEKIKSISIIERCLLYKAAIYLKLGDYNQASIIAHHIVANSSNSLNLMNANYLLASIAFQHHLYAECGIYLAKIVVINKTGTDFDQKGQIEYNLLLTNYYQHQGDFKHALITSQQVARLQIAELVKQKDYRLIKAQLALNKREKYFANQKAHLQQQKYKAKTERFYIEKLLYSLFVFVLISALFIVIRSILLFKKRNRQLREFTFILENLVDEKEVLLKEVHHRVKNNFQIITSMLSIQSRKKHDNLPAFIQQFSARIHSMAYIHDQLYQQKDLNELNVYQFITDLFTNISTTFQPTEKNITCSMNKSDVTLPIQILIPIGLIINELATNSFKYAFIDKRSGAINVLLTQKENSIQLCYSDNGSGMDDTTIQHTGLVIVDAFVRKLQGSIEVKNANGVFVTITIPMKTGL
jgi:two-component sensor histidine kinase